MEIIWAIIWTKHLMRVFQRLRFMVFQYIQLPQKALEKPQYTQGREGFYHVVSFNGDCEYAKIEINVRDHDSLQFDIRNNTLKMIVDMLNEEYGQGTVNITQRIQYRNLKEVIDQVPFMIPYLKQAIESIGLTPQTEPFRGGTDGSALSHRGLVLTYQRDMRMRMDVLNMFPFSRWKRMWKSY